jgi:hypothetical protein
MVGSKQGRETSGFEKVGEFLDQLNGNFLRGTVFHSVALRSLHSVFKQYACVRNRVCPSFHTFQLENRWNNAIVLVFPNFLQLVKIT